MTTVAVIPRVGASATLKKQRSDRRNVLEANQATLTQQPQFHGVKGRSELLLPKPHHNKRARRVIVKETDELTRKQKEVEKALSRVSQTNRSDLAAEDLLFLSKRERRHLRFRSKILKERTSLYKSKPSSKRAFDLDLTRSWLKFKKRLATKPEDREPAAKAGVVIDNDDDDDEDEEETSSPGAKSISDGQTGVHTKMGPRADEVGPVKTGSSNGANDVPQSTSSSKDDDHECPIPRMDGAFDDHIRAQTKKRKLVDGPADLESQKEQRKKAKKERMKAKKEQARKEKHQAGATSASESQPVRPNTSIRDRETDFVEKSAATKSMSQSKKLEAKVISSDETADDSSVNGAKVNGNTANRPAANSKETYGDKAQTVRTNGVNVNVHPTNSVTNNIPKLNTSVEEPWYKIHARKMMEPDFDDLVYERRRKSKHNPAQRQKPYPMSGAVLDHPEDEEVVSGALPSPPTSSSSPSFGSVEKVDRPRDGPGAKERVEKPRVAKARKQAARLRSRSHPSPDSAGEP